jgi:hypothetical protein
MMSIKKWSTAKALVVLMIVFGFLLHVLTTFFYFIMYENPAFAEYANLLFSVPIVFICWSTIVFAIKFHGFPRRLISGVAALIFQVILLSLVLIAFTALDGFKNFMTPQYLKNDLQLTTDIIERFNKKYEIQNIVQDRVLHSSFYRVGEEFGYDLILQIKKSDIQKYKPKGSKFVPLSGNTDDTPFRFNNKSLLCGSTKIKISDVDVKRIICGEKIFPSNTMIAEKWVRVDWTITSVYFPTAGVIWITEIEW